MKKRKVYPTEYQYEFEQEMLKHVHDLKKDLRKKGYRTCLTYIQKIKYTYLINIAVGQDKRRKRGK